MEQIHFSRESEIFSPTQTSISILCKTSLTHLYSFQHILPVLFVKPCPSISFLYAWTCLDLLFVCACCGLIPRILSLFHATAKWNGFQLWPRNQGLVLQLYSNKHQLQWWQWLESGQSTHVSRTKWPWVVLHSVSPWYVYQLSIIFASLNKNRKAP